MEGMLPQEAVPIRLMATIWADTAGLHDDLRSTEDLTAWLEATALDRAEGAATAAATAAVTTAADLELARRLRDALRRLAAQVTGDDRSAAQSATAEVEDAVRDLNDVLTLLPTPRIVLADGTLQPGTAGDSSAIAAVLARIAQESIALLAGPEADKLRACYAPGCVLYFVKTHPRREWCSVTCGNRVRAARHYGKVRSGH